MQARIKRPDRRHHQGVVRSGGPKTSKAPVILGLHAKREEGAGCFEREKEAFSHQDKLRTSSGGLSNGSSVRECSH